MTKIATKHKNINTIAKKIDTKHKYIDTKRKKIDTNRVIGLSKTLEIGTYNKSHSKEWLLFNINTN